MKIHILALIAVLMIPGVLYAYEFKSGDTIVVKRGQTIDDDIATAASEVAIEGRVTGDVLAAGQAVRSEGSVTGSINAAGNNVNISGTVGNDVYLAGSSVDLDASVGDNAMLFGGQVRVGGDARTTRDLIIAGGDISVRGDVGRNLKASGSTVRIGGTIGGNAEVNAEKLILLPGANIRGNLTYSSPNKAEIQPGAVVQGRTIHKPVERHKDGFRAVGVIWRILSFLALTLVGLILLALMPATSTGIAQVVRTSFWWSLLWGFIFFVVVPAAAFLIMFTVIGIPLALMILAIYFILLYVGQVFTALALGGVILRNRDWTGRSRYLAFIIGLLVISLVGLIPYIGWLVSFAAVLVGFGATLLYMYNWNKSRRTEGIVAPQ